MEAQGLITGGAEDSLGSRGQRYMVQNERCPTTPALPAPQAPCQCPMPPTCPPGSAACLCPTTMRHLLGGEACLLPRHSWPGAATTCGLPAACFSVPAMQACHAGSHGVFPISLLGQGH